jgi:integrase
VIFAALTGLRWGELVALRVRDVDLDAGMVHVVRKFAELQNGERVPGRPKSDAGLRTVALPSVLVAVVRQHLAEFPPSDPEDLIFNGPKGRRCGETTSIDQRVGPNASPRPDSLRASGSTICATQETPWRPRRGRAHGS